MDVSTVKEGEIIGCSFVTGCCMFFTPDILTEDGRIFTEEVIPAQRGSILARNGEPLATSIFRYQAAFDPVGPGVRIDPYDNQIGEATVGERSVDAGSYVRSVELLGMEELPWEDSAV